MPGKNAKSKKSLHAIKTLFYRISPPPTPKGALSLFFLLEHTINPHGMEGIAKRTPDPLYISSARLIVEKKLFIKNSLIGFSKKPLYKEYFKVIK